MEDSDADTTAETRLTILGSHHLAQPGNDEHGTDAGDPLDDGRQRELAALRDRLAGRSFDWVGLEIPRDHRDALAEQVDAVDAAVAERGEAVWTDPDEWPDGPLRVRGEAVQIGLRLARRLDARVHAVDSQPAPPDPPAGSTAELDWSLAVDSEAVPYDVPDPEAVVADRESRVAESSYLELFRHTNREPQLQQNHRLNVAASLSSSELSASDTTGEAESDTEPPLVAADATTDYAGARQLGYWYERNARICENCRAVATPSSEGMLVIGAAHVIPVRQVADAAVGITPASPLPLLTDDEP
ncbi:DUF5694 domain-containing protein [Halobaculum sp. MBLA0147]|uniref:DUF5694 domain-containing protein n=1 Tax=Halobaculum sp. MBLA0147 TaxID=3079934 RepID=UPI0035269912